MLLFWHEPVFTLKDILRSIYSYKKNLVGHIKSNYLKAIATNQNDLKVTFILNTLPEISDKMAATCASSFTIEYIE